MPASVQPIVSMMAVRASLSARAVMSSARKAQIFSASRVASGGKAAPLPVRAAVEDCVSATVGYHENSSSDLRRGKNGGSGIHRPGLIGQEVLLHGSPS